MTSLDLGGRTAGWRTLSSFRELARHRFIFFFGLVLPFTIYGVFVFYPIVYNVYLSFTKWNGLAPKAPFVGLANYRRLLFDPGFHNALINSAIWALLSLAIHIVVGAGLAILLNSGRVRYPTLFRSLVFVPVTMSLVSIGLMFSLILSPNFGAVDQLLKALGLGFLIRPWLGDFDVTLYVLILIDAWAYLGIPLMLFHAGIASIDPALYEAARLDGANERQIAWHVTVPSLKPQFLIVTMLSVIHSLKTFDIVSVMTGGGPAGGSSVLGYFMYTVAFRRNDFAYGATVGVVMLIIAAGFALAYLKGIARDSLHAE